MDRESGDPAVSVVQQAREVVGLYGDPDSAWGVGLEVAFDAPLDLEDVDERMAALTRDFPHLGSPAPVRVVGAQEWKRERAQCASREFGEGGRLVRVMVSTDSRTVFVAAHHGVTDGMGMLAIAEAVAAAGLHSEARGIQGRTSPRSFLWSSVLRLGEALFRPPARFLGTAQVGGDADQLDLMTLPATRANTVRMCVVIARVLARWPGRGRVARRHPLVIVGVSRRKPGELGADRQTGYMRVPLDASWGEQEMRRRFERLDPEPDFPETSAGGVGPLVTRLLKNRLGATATLSNLGVIHGSGLRSVAMFPALSGPHAVGIGVASTSESTTLTLRTRTSEFGPDESRTLLSLLVEELGADGP